MRLHRGGLERFAPPTRYTHSQRITEPAGDKVSRDEGRLDEVGNGKAGRELEQHGRKRKIEDVFRQCVGRGLRKHSDPPGQKAQTDHPEERKGLQKYPYHPVVYRTPRRICRGPP